MSQVNATLRRARARIAESERWTTWAYARNEAGQPTRVDSDDACCWDAVGAVDVESPDGEVYAHAMIALAAATGIEATEEEAAIVAIAGVNDREGHQATIAVFDRAIFDTDSEQR